MPQNFYQGPRIGPTPPPRIGPTPVNPWERYQQAPTPLDSLRQLYEASGAGQGEGGSASGSPYDISRARQAAGVRGQVGGDISLGSPPTLTDIELPDESMNRRADAINADVNSNYFTDTLQYPTQMTQASSGTNPAFEGLKANTPRVMPGAGTPIEAMQTFAGSGTANLPLEVARLREEQKAQEERQATPNVARLAMLNRDITEDPFIGQAAQERQAAEDKLYRQSYLGGFRTPQEAAEAERQAETYKQDAPVRAQQVAGQFDVQQQQEASRGALDVAREQGQGATNFLTMMQQLQQSGAAPDIRSITAPRGGGSVSFAPTVQAPAAIQRDVTIARQNLAKAKAEAPRFPGSWLGVGRGQVEAAEAQVKAAIDTALANFNIQDPESKQEITAAIMNPENQGKQIGEVFDLSQMTPDEQRQLMNFITLIGGF